jgi:predicted house-cleaning noncanonical NTP pyrophosphatase (MazG superfamily)
MTKKIFNKLVRDKIPEVISANGATSKTRIVQGDEFLQSLSDKIVEEAIEVKEAGNNRKELIKELGDV